MGNVYSYGLNDFQAIATGAAVLASGGGGSYTDACSIVQELASQGFSGAVTVQDYDGATPACVLAIMGSPDAASSLDLAAIQNSISNTLAVQQAYTGMKVGALIPVEIGPINSLVPLIGAALSGGSVWVVNGDGAGRAVPELPQTTFTAPSGPAPSPAVLASDAASLVAAEYALLGSGTASGIESLAGGVVGGFGGYSGIAMWPSNANNQFALSGSYIEGTLEQARALGQQMLQAVTPLSTAAVATAIQNLTGRTAAAVVTNFYVTAVTQSTSSATSLDSGVIRLDNAQDPSQSTQTHYLYNLNENLIMYSASSTSPDIIAPDSICYYSESTGRGFSNANDDLALYFNTATGRSTGQMVSVISVQTAPQLYNTLGVVASFAGLLRKIGYAGGMPLA
ncbi:S-methyl thiohydantoin desulfurase domain-containing protein [Acidovorax sp. LjRoot194]|uniref:S-methyl thiohydantoin desulfurase domain-containing protein n=1 Tax=Acidovorax sp. LjRoot194 TaxID=3342280 RepID=UPI003ECD7FB7